MKGMVLTAPGDPFLVPSSAELVKLFVDSPTVRLDFSKIFDRDSDSKRGREDAHAHTITL
jgi:hypothetical protein